MAKASIASPTSQPVCAPSFRFRLCASTRIRPSGLLALGRNDPQLRHLDHAWAATVHAFQGRTVDNVIAAMEANHPHLTTQKSFYVEISRARDRAELVTDDATQLRERLETATGERISALEAVAPREQDTPAKGAEVSVEPAAPAALKRSDVPTPKPEADRSAEVDRPPERGRDDRGPKDRRPAEREPRKEMEFELELEL